MSVLNKLVWILAPVGVLLALGAWLWGTFKGPLPGGTAVYVTVGGALVLLHLLLKWEDIVTAIGGRQLMYGTFSLVLIAAVLGILGGVNWYVSRHSKRWDLTKNQRYSLSDATKKSLAALKEDITIVYFHGASDLGLGQSRMKEYQQASSRIKVEFVNPTQSPAKARQYDVSQVPTLVVERGTRREKVSNDSEQDITNAIIKVTRDVQKTVCFVDGEGERSLDDSQAEGYSAAKSALQKSQYQTKTVTLLREGSVPADCTVAVLAGPATDLAPPVAAALRDYVKKSGRLLAMAEPEFKDKTPLYVGLLKEWNLEAGSDLVVDVSPGTMAQTGPETPLGIRYPPHDVTKDLTGLATAFHTARSLKPGAASTPGVFAQSLVETDRAAWGETDFTSGTPVKLDPGKDTPGPVSLGAVATIAAETPATPPPASPAPSPEASPEPPKKEGRVIAFGDADFASNTFIQIQGNRDLFLNA
ncbi:MAG: GldG family protein, partial [Vicinamibacteria bacterium]